MQYTVKNGFEQETTNFYPFEQIKSFYVFESFDGLKTGHFFALKLEKEDNVVFFEVKEQLSCLLLI